MIRILKVIPPLCLFKFV